MSAGHIDSERPRVCRVLRNVPENRLIHTIFFKDEACSGCKPGQFLMVWAPGYDEMPMSLSDYNADGMSSVTVKPWGGGSRRLSRLKEGAVIGVRGPYGNPFTVDRRSSLLVGGGTGLAPLMPLAREITKAGGKATVVIGGRSRGDLLFEKRARMTVGGANVFVTTDDGSRGIMGFPTDVAGEIIKARKIERICTCGPEVMMRKLFEIASSLGVECEASLERGMKCGFGICGSCTVGPYLLCRDGPVLDERQLRGVSDEFGLLQRDHSGRYVSI